MICDNIKSECVLTDKANKNALTTAHFDNCKRIPDQWDLLTIAISVIAAETPLISTTAFEEIYFYP